MPLSSMTGFARTQGAYDNYTWAWEIRSVNGRGLDVRSRLPAGFDALEQEVRAAVSKRIKRGNLQASLKLSSSGAPAQLTVNEDVLAQVLKALGKVGKQAKAAPPTADGILSIRGVTELVEPEQSEEERQAFQKALLDSFREALDALVGARASEGRAMAATLSDHLARIEGLTKEAENCASLDPEAIRDRLRKRVEELLDDTSVVSEERLAQEVALLAVKSSVREELDRLYAHIAAAHELLAVDEPTGRKLDFLIQEFNREANTVCSKASDLELTRIGLDLKAVIDDVREQVQNIE